ncbi:hypothetical protein HO173_008090 [Letharia columbiana]|uniref:Uncharacterized protein n=1 Tax=Letharia columbiana TaxID=112416 RepID=A0A8H6FSL0_9LECA|nr:uncharacterized protein HO173_008090 [Letharia columbiana]KAF6233878.1 hypothetical protein HO173_008090 [Letharia columbiana]
MKRLEHQDSLDQALTAIEEKPRLTMGSLGPRGERLERWHDAYATRSQVRDWVPDSGTDRCVLEKEMLAITKYQKARSFMIM